MEFDTSINLKPVATHFVKSDKDLEAFVHELWDKSLECASEVANAGETEIWLDCSDMLRTRHLSVYAEPVEGGYRLTFKAGSKPSRIGDAVMMVCILIAFWLGSKVLVPQPPVFNIVGAVLALLAAGATLLYAGKAFGKEKVDELINKL